MSIEVGTKVRILDTKTVCAPSYLNGKVGEVVRTHTFHDGFDVTFEDDDTTWAFRRENVEIVGEVTYTIDQIREALGAHLIPGFLIDSIVDTLTNPPKRVVIEGTVRLEVDAEELEDYASLTDLLLDYFGEAEIKLTSKEVS